MMLRPETLTPKDGARDALSELVSYIHEVLTGPYDQHIRENLLEIAAHIDNHLREL